MPRTSELCEVCKVYVPVSTKTTHENGDKHLQKKLKIGNRFILTSDWKNSSKPTK